MTNYSEFVSAIAKSGDEIVCELTPEKAHIWHMATGIVGESGEIIDQVKKHVCYNRDLDLANMIEELGDIEFYMEGMRQAIGVTREQVLQYNIEKLRKRYPNGTFTNTHAQVRLDKK